MNVSLKVLLNFFQKIAGFQGGALNRSPQRAKSYFFKVIQEAKLLGRQPREPPKLDRLVSGNPARNRRNSLFFIKMLDYLICISFAYSLDLDYVFF